MDAIRDSGGEVAGHNLPILNLLDSAVRNLVDNNYSTLSRDSATLLIDDNPSTVRYVGLRGGAPKLTTLERLSDFPRLSTLNFYECRITDDVIFTISRLRSLESIGFYNCQVKSQSFEPLRSISKLRFLSFATRRPEEILHVGSLGQLMRLQALLIHGYTIEGADFGQFAANSQLLVLRLAGCNIVGGVAELERFKSLCELSLQTRNTEWSEIGVIAKLPLLAFFDGPRGMPNESAIEQMQKCKALKSLSLTSDQMKDSSQQISGMDLENIRIQLPGVDVTLLTDVLYNN